MEIDDVFALAEELARRVGARMREVTEGGLQIRVQHKGPTDLVTEVDLWAEQMIRAEVAQRFPTHAFIGEEWASQQAAAGPEQFESLSKQDFCWVVDPVDGTSNFANGIPHSVVSIAVLRAGVRTLGLVYDPYRDELFSARRGAGAFLNGRPIFCSQKTELIDAVVATGFPHEIHKDWENYRALHDAASKNFRKLRVFGAAALDISWVACGRLDAFIENGIKSWDVAAATLILEEAGGKVGSITAGEENSYSIFAPSILASSKTLYSKIYECLPKQ